jgi:hypothetical protein
MRSLAALLILGALALPTSAHPDGSGPRAQIRVACKADADALCRGVQPGEGRIRACLRANREKLSQPCRDAIAAALEARAAKLEERASRLRAGTPAP